MEGVEQKQLQPHEQRVVDERTELMDKITNLHLFINKNAIFKLMDKIDQDLLLEQVQTMMNYADILLKRINRF